MNPLLVGLCLVALACVPTAAAWSVTTPDVFDGGCRSVEGRVGGASGPFVQQNGNCTWTVGCEDLIAKYCE